MQGRLPVCAASLWIFCALGFFVLLRLTSGAILSGHSSGELSGQLIHYMCVTAKPPCMSSSCRDLNHGSNFDCSGSVLDGGAVTTRPPCDRSPIRWILGCRIAKTEGIAALYVGIGPSLLGMIPSGAVYYWYDLPIQENLSGIPHCADALTARITTFMIVKAQVCLCAGCMTC